MTEKIPSTSDERVRNNVVRHEYRVLTDGEKAQMLQFKDIGLHFIEVCDEIGASDELSLAKTRMEEAVMWAVKHVTRPKDIKPPPEPQEIDDPEGVGNYRG